MRHPRQLLTGAALLVAAVTGCSASTSGGAASAGVGGQDPGVEHVHGLGVDPADGVLYAASHYGLFRVPEQGDPVRVADRRQDTMGFTVVGPGRFLGSGHPDARMDPELPPRLGLIASADAARSWQSISLSGTADFHALHAAHGSIYGWESGTGALMVSPDDGRSWDTRSTLALRDFAVSPTDPDVLLATTAVGLLGSTDGGRSWQQIGQTPPLAVLAWAPDGSLFGISPDGTVQHSADGARSWAARGNAGGPPEAVSVNTRDSTTTLYVAVSGRGILASVDGGGAFTSRHTF